jgi:transposase-like protein
MAWKRVEPMEERCRFILRAGEPKANIAALCREYEASRKTGYKWLERFEVIGLDLTEFEGYSINRGNQCRRIRWR